MIKLESSYLYSFTLLCFKDDFANVCHVIKKITMSGDFCVMRDQSKYGYSKYHDIMPCIFFKESVYRK